MLQSINKLNNLLMVSCGDYYVPSSEDFKFSEEAIKLGIKRALTRIRSVPPVIRSLNIELSDFDNEDKRMFLLDGVIAYVYEARSLQEKRNELSIQEEGAVIQDDHRFSDYMQVSARKMQIFENYAVKG